MGALVDRIVLAYAGGFDAAAAIAALKARYGAEIIVVTMDLGQGQVLEELRDRALAAGAARAHVLDLRDSFATGYVLPSLQADAVGEDGAPMAAALGKALIADKLVELARIEQAAAVAHGPTAPSGDTLLLDRAIASSDPQIRIVPLPDAPLADGDFSHRVGVNLWGRTIDRVGRDGRPEELPEAVYKVTKAAASCPAEPAFAEVRFEGGAPVSLNGVPMPLVELIASLTCLAGAHGVGRLLTALAALEAPAAAVLHAAHRELQKRSASRDGDRVSRQYADIIATGLWSTPARAALDKTIQKSQKRLNGSIRVKLFQGGLTFAD